MKLATYIANGTEGSLGGLINVGGTYLRNKNIISIKRDGIGLSKIKSSGFPANKEATHFALTGTILVAQETEQGEVFTILYQNQ